ncbi:MAG: hypothetical protein CVV44_17120 [Spirochaetae bacterium HGW-Spirochaetae-1]|jgi:TolA-binding protein|nr:MAG: hypothetical protein CVV44_17120 [Spirochaetae bacterium HGW-Spirochaetae-1]
MKKEAVIGIILIFLGMGFFAYYDQFIKPEENARQLLREGKLVFERGNKEALNDSINLFTKIIARYPETESARDAYYFIAQSYEKLGLNRLAYLKYIYILKNEKNISEQFASEVKARIARLTIMKQQTEEGVHQLLDMLNYSANNDFRSRVYTELGHTYLKGGEYSKSKRMFDIALSENGSNEEAILGKARAFKRLGEDDKAYDLYEYFLKYYGDFSPYSHDLRSAYLSQLYNSAYNSYKRGSYYKSIEYFSRLIRFFPGYKKTENALYWIGENYFALKKYELAINYFDRTLLNGFPHKDEDARMKKGYSYFMAKRFDLSAREFQQYLKDYPHGRHVSTAKKWKEMSTREILYRIKDKMEPEDEKDMEKEPDKGKDLEKEESDEESVGDDLSNGADEVSNTESAEESELENVAEL